MNNKRNDERNDETILIKVAYIGGLAILAGLVFTMAFVLGIKTPIEKYLLCVFVLLGVLFLTIAACRQFMHRNDFCDECEKNLNKIMGK